MASKNLDAFKLGVVLDAAGAAKGIAALADADKKATKLDGSLKQLGKGIKFGLAEHFKSELAEVEKLAGSSRAGAVGQQLGGMIGGGLKDGIMSVVSASNLGKLIGSAIAPGVGTVVGGLIGSAVDTAIDKAAGPLKELIQQGLDLNEVLDRATVHFEDVLGSREQALKHLADLNDIEGKSGIDLRQLISASQRLEEFNEDLSLTTVELKAAAAQSVVFGSGVEGFHSIANALGLIAEKGELTARTLLKLEKQGIHSTQYLAEGLGLSEKKVKQLIAQNRIRGDGAARIIAEGIVAHKGAQSERVINSTLYGQRNLFENNLEELAGQGTRNMSGAIKDSYALGNTLLTSSQAQQTVQFIDHAAGSLLKLTRAAIETGYDVTSGLVRGMLDPSGLMQGASRFATKFIEAVRSPAGFDSHSPALKMIPIGEDNGAGVIVGFEGYMAGEGVRRLTNSISETVARARAEALVRDPRVRAMLDAIGYSEGTDKRYGYETHVGGRRSAGPAGQKDRSIVYLGPDRAGRPLSSSADGRYQFLNKTWDGDARALGLSDFSPHSQDLAAVYELMKSGAITPLMNGNFAGAVNSARKVWASFPGAGYNQGERSLSALQRVYDRSLSVGGSPISPANPLPVVVARDLTGGVGTFAGPRTSEGHAFGDWGQGTDGVVPVATAIASLDTPVEEVRLGLSDLAVMLPTATTSTGIGLAMLEEETRRASEGTRAYSKSQEEYRKATIIGVDSMTKAAGALGQIAGMLPGGGGQVGRKRGFFSKLLGIASPFLSLIPGVGPVLGPILSSIAGMGSAALAGNWSGVVSGLATGLSAGGAFRPVGSTPAPALGDVSVGQGSVGVTVNTSPPQRAAGGPVLRGRAYRLNEFRDEVVEFPEDGYVHPSVSSYERSRGGARRGSMAEMIFRLLDQVEQHTAAVAAHGRATEQLQAKISSMPADHVVTVGAPGARRAIADAYHSHASRDPKTIEWMQRRMVA